MIDRILPLELPPFASEQDTLRARMVLIGVLVLLGGVTVALAWTLMSDATTAPLLAVQVGSVVLLLLCVSLLRRGRLRAAGLILIASAISSAFLLMALVNGFYDTAMLILPLAFLSASFLLPKKDYALVVVLCMLGLTGIFALHMGGWYTNEIARAHQPDVPYDFGIILLMYCLTGAVPYVFTAQLNRLLERVQSGERQLRELNATLDAKVAARTAELERSNRELEQANRELKTFERSLSHSLRTPLRHVGGYADILLEDNASSLGPEERDLVRRMKGAAVDLGQMGDALLAYSRLNDRMLDPAPLDPARLWQSLVEEALPALAGREIEWVCATVPACIGDPVLIRQALKHLLDNALKFSSRRPRTRIEFGYDAARRAWFVRDNGTGLDMAYADKLFKVFERLHSKSEYPGLGMGLAMVSRIVLRHGGHMEIDSRMGEGATFYFTLPHA